MWENFALLSPAFGMIGTLIGLVKMLGNMDDPTAIGPSMAVGSFDDFVWIVDCKCCGFTPDKKVEVPF